MLRQPKLLVAAKIRRTDATRLTLKPEKSYDRTDAHATLLGGLGYGSPAINRFDHASTQVLRIRLRHPCWPPPSRKLESYSRSHGNPRFSLFGKPSWRMFHSPFCCSDISVAHLRDLR